MSTSTAMKEEKDFNKLIMKLREATGAGMMDCKKALTEANGSYDEAVTILRKKGIAGLEKKAGRTTNEGVVAFAVAGPSAAIVELNCETDFVARNEEFVALGKTLAEKFAKGEFTSVDQAKDSVTTVYQKLRENMGLKRFTRFELSGPGLLSGYIHLGAKKGALIEFSAPSADAAKNPALAELAKELLLQIVGSPTSPKYLKREEVPAAEIEKEKEIHAEILRKEGKPEASIPKIIEGKLNKLFYQQYCLLEQMSIRDPKVSISNLVKDASTKLGGPVAVVRFTRYQLGE